MVQRVNFERNLKNIRPATVEKDRNVQYSLGYNYLKPVADLSSG